MSSKFKLFSRRYNFKIKLIIIIFLLNIIPAISMAYEEPFYRLIEQNDIYEIRYYDERIVVQTKNTNENSGFRRLFNYISGQNNGSQKIAMTAPVTQSNDIMQFYLPSNFDITNTPIPLDQNVELSTVEEGYYAVIRYSGRSSNSSFLSHSNILQNELLTKGVNILSKPIKATYNGPFTPGFMRRNEAMFLVEWKS